MTLPPPAAIKARSQAPGRAVRGATAAGVRVRVVLAGGYSLRSRIGPASVVLGSLDGSVQRWFLEHQGDEFMAIMRVVALLGHPTVLACSLAACVYLARGGTAVRPWRYAVYLSVCVVLDSVASQSLVSTALLTGSAWLVIRQDSRTWRRAVLTLTALVALTPLIALAHVYLGDRHPSDILFAWLTGTLFAPAAAASWTTRDRETATETHGELRPQEVIHAACPGAPLV